MFHRFFITFQILEEAFKEYEAKYGKRLVIEQFDELNEIDDEDQEDIPMPAYHADENATVSDKPAMQSDPQVSNDLDITKQHNICGYQIFFHKSLVM